MAQVLEPGPMQIQHGHTDTHVFVKFTRMTESLILTNEQTDAFIKALQDSKRLLAEHKAKGGKLTPLNG